MIYCQQYVICIVGRSWSCFFPAKLGTTINFRPPVQMVALPPAMLLQAAAMLYGRMNGVLLAWAAVCTVNGTKTGFGTAPLATNRQYPENLPLTLTATFADMWLQGTFRGTVSSRCWCKIRCEMPALSLLVIVIATAVGGPQFPSLQEQCILLIELVIA
jgi:hypothetical protein